MDLLAVVIVQQDLIFGGVARLAEALNAWKAGGGEQQFGIEPLRRVHRDKRSGYIQPAGTRGGLHRLKRLLWSGNNGSGEERTRQTRKKGAAVNRNHGDNLWNFNASKKQMRPGMQPGRIGNYETRLIRSSPAP